MRASVLLPVLAAVGFATAQKAPKICSEDATIENQSDATNIATQCKKFDGNIEIAGTVEGAINLDGIAEITGDLKAVEVVKMTQLTSNTLSTIGGTMYLKSLTIMSDLSMPVLEKVGALDWTTLNALQALNFQAPLSQAKRIFITDTALTSLDGINLEQVDTFEVTNNAFLRTISTQVANITQALTINNNGLNLNLELPNLIWANNMTVRNVSQLSIPSLQSVNSTFGVYGSYMESVMAPNLTKIGGDVAYVGDAKLTNISMPMLTTIGGGLLIANCSKLMEIDGFPKLKTTGAINISGNFTAVDFEELSDVKGTFNAQSSGNFSCKTFDKLKDDQIVKGLYYCKARSDNVQASVTQTKAGTIGASETGSPDSSSDQGAASGLAISGSAVTFFGLLAAVLAL